MFSRTYAGIRNSDLFYRDQYIVYVEGQDDVPFWSLFFPKEINGYECKFKTVGGSEIKKYVNSIFTDKATFVVALDSDYRLFMNEMYKHVQIVETLAHSIENLIIAPHTLAEIIRIESREEFYDALDIQIWLDYFDESMHGLMAADYLIQRENFGKKGIGKNILRFLEDSPTKKPIFDLDKIGDFIEKLGLIEDLYTIVKEDLRDYRSSKHIRGHFFFSASLCFVNHEVNRLRNNKVRRSISNESFYTMLIMNFKNLLADFPEFKDLKEKSINASKEVVHLLSIR